MAKNTSSENNLKMRNARILIDAESQEKIVETQKIEERNFSVSPIFDAAIAGIEKIKSVSQKNYFLIKYNLNDNRTIIEL